MDFVSLQVWRPTVLASSGHHVLLNFGLLDLCPIRCSENVQHWEGLNAQKTEHHVSSELLSTFISFEFHKVSVSKQVEENLTFFSQLRTSL